MITMPIAGRLTDRYGPELPAGGRHPAAGDRHGRRSRSSPRTPPTCFCCGFSFVLGLGMGLAMMPTMTAAMQAVPAGGDRPHQHRDEHHPPVRRVDRHRDPVGDPRLGDRQPVQLGPGVKAGGGGFAALQQLSPVQHAVIAGPLASAFASTFVWALALLALAFVPALGMALYRPTTPPVPSGQAQASPLVLD